MIMDVMPSAFIVASSLRICGPLCVGFGCVT